MICLNDNKLRTYKIRVEGADQKGKNTTRQLSVLAHSIEEVIECLTDAVLDAGEKAGK